MDLISAAGKGVQGDFVGMAAGLLQGLLSGHSPWYKADQRLAANDWRGFSDYMIDFYNRGGLHDADFAGGIDGDVVAKYKGRNVPRYTLLPDMVKNLPNDPAVLQMYKDAVNNGLIQDTQNLAGTRTYEISGLFGSATKNSQDDKANQNTAWFGGQWGWFLLIPFGLLVALFIPKGRKRRRF